MVRRASATLVAVLLPALVAAGAAVAGDPPAVSAPAYVLESTVDGTTLAARNADMRRPVASITKLMTVLVALEHARLDEVVAVPFQATRVRESSLSLQPGEPLTVAQLAIGSLVPSANDAATALALHVGRGSLDRFVALMNRKARELGMRSTRFRNPHGLDQPGHVSSAGDTVLLLRAALEHRFIRTWAKKRSATLPGRPRLVSTDGLLRRLPELIGAKTGHTSGAGWSQVAGARADGVTVFASVLGAETEAARDADLQALLLYGLAQYRRSVVVDPARTYAVVAAGWGLPGIPLIAKKAIVRPTPVGRPLVERVVAPIVAVLPVRAGERLGEVRVYDGRRLVARAPLVAARGVGDPSSLGKARYVATRTVEHLAGFVS